MTLGILSEIQKILNRQKFQRLKVVPERKKLGRPATFSGVNDCYFEKTRSKQPRSSETFNRRDSRRLYLPRWISN